MRQPKWLSDARELVQPPPDGDLNILVFDIETSPEANWTWGRYKVNTLANLRPQYMLSFVYTWYGTGEYHFVGQNKDPKYIPDHPYRKPRKNQDRWVVAQLWHLMGMADIVVAHNGNQFDVPFQQGREMYYHVAPPPPHASIDTLATVKKHARFTSNRLNDLSQHLLNESKVSHYGIDTWFGCMFGDPGMWEMMEEYNLQDVRLLEELYTLLIPWIKRRKNLSLPNTNDYTNGRPTICPAPGCGGTRLIIRGHLPPTTAGMVYRRFQCKKCGGYFKANYAERNYTPPVDRVS